MFQKILTSCLLTLVAIGGFFVSFESNNKYGVVQIGFENGTYASDVQLTNQYGSDALKEADGRFTSKAATPQSTAVKDMYNKLVAGLNIAMAVVTMLVSPAIMLAGWLMSPDWTSGDLFGLREVMYSLWVTISNITYFIYAVLLIFIALATIFGQENYGYKAMLPKLALGIILVPFTWWFVQWTISLATIVTASVITIPNEALESVVQGKGWWNSPVIPKKVVIDESSSIEGNAAAKAAEKCPDNCISPQQMISKSSGLYGHMLIYAYGVFKLNEIKKIENATDFVGGIIRLIHDGIISVIMLIVFGLLTLALIFMLLARAVMLWVYTIFSPFMTLELVMGGVMKNISEDFSIKEFIGLAFVPALVGLALSFGLVMVAAVQSPIRSVSTACSVSTLKSEQGCQLISIMGSPENKISRKLVNVKKDGKFTTVNEVKFGDVTYEFRGKIGGATDLDAEAASASSAVSVISSAGGVFGTVVIDIIALLFIWMAFMAAKGVSKVVDAAAKPFEDMGKKIGALGASLPKYMPIPGLGVSASGMSKIAAMPETILSQKSAEGVKKYEDQISKAFGVSLKYGTSEQESMKNIKENDGGRLVDKLNSLNAKKVDLKSPEGTKLINDSYEALGRLTENERTTRGVKNYNKDESDINVKMKAIELFRLNDNKTNRSEHDIINNWKEGAGSTGTTTSNSTTNNSFNIVTDISTGKYTLTGTNLKSDKPMTKDEMLDALKKNIHLLIPLTNEAITSELKEMKLSPDELKKFLEVVDTKRKEEAEKKKS